MRFFYIIGRYQQIKKTAKKCGKSACIFSALMLFYQSCGMIAVKREVATEEFRWVFRGANVNFEKWRQVTVPS